MIHIWLFPWLPILGDTLGSLWKTIRRKLQLYLREWSPAQEYGLHLVQVWSEVWDDDDLQSLLTNAILPQVILYLRKSFVVNPSNQDLEPLLNLVKWKSIIPNHLFSNLLATEFFPGWLQCLWAWIQSSQANLDEISQWYTHWKQFFRDHDLDGLEAVKEGFRTGLDMMNQGISQSIKGTTFIPRASSKSVDSKKKVPIAGGAVEMTFRDLVEALASEASIEFLPLGKRHANGKELFRLGSNMHAYIDNGVLFCASKGEKDYKFMALDDALKMAASGNSS